MLLRRSGTEENQDYNLAGVTAAADQIGVDNEALLLSIAEAVVSFDQDLLVQLAGSHPDINPQFFSDAIAVASGFNGITKIANATGLPLDDSTETDTKEMREQTGIDKYSEAAKQKSFG